MICKRCWHPDYCHHEGTGKCNAVNMKYIREYYDEYIGIRRWNVEAEFLGDCDCNG